MIRHVAGVLVPCLLAALPLTGHCESPAVAAGDYRAAMTTDGLQVTYRDALIVSGGRLTIFKPGYTGNVYASSDLAGRPTAGVQVEGRRISVSDALPELEGSFAHETEVDEGGVTVTFRLHVGKDIEGHPVEFASAVLPVELFAGGSYRVLSLLGERDPAPLSPQPPERVGLGSVLLMGNVHGLRIAGEGVEVIAESLYGQRPNFYDMRARDFRPNEKAFWVLHQWNATRGEAAVQVRISAQEADTTLETERAEGTVVITQDGHKTPLSAICVARDAHPIERAAAGELQRYLARMTGVELPVIVAGEAERPDGGAIFVGRHRDARRARMFALRELDDLGPDGLVIRARDGNVLLAGGGHRGTAYAVFRFLERLGCRFWSTDLEVVPERPMLEIQAPLDISDQPAFEWRAMWGTVSPMKVSLSPGEWAARVGEVDVPKMMAIPPGGFWHHTMPYLVRAEDWFETHPEYFAELGGERRQVAPALQQHCLSNADLRALMTQKVLEWIEASPDQLYYPVHFGDVVHFCSCEECRAMYAEHGSISDTVIWFLNEIGAEVAEKHPDKFLTILAYHATRPAPLKFRPLPNVLIVFCAIVECQGRPWSHPVNVKRNVMRDLEEWVRIHPLGPEGIMTFDYPISYHYTGFPYPALYAFVDNIRYYHRLGLRGVYVCGLSARSHLVHLYSHVIPQIMWDPSRDLGALVEEFCRAWYGAAWEPMRDYADLIHHGALASTSEGVMDCHAGPGQRFFRELFTREFLDRAHALFARAEERADSEVVRRRIWSEKWGLMFVDLFLHAQMGRDVVPDESEEGFRRVIPGVEDFERMAEFLRLTRMFDRPWDMVPRRGYTLSSIVGFEPTASPWWTCPRIREVMDDPRAAHEREARVPAEVVEGHLPALENEHMRVTLVPALGGRIWRMLARASGEDLLWRGALPWHAVQEGLRDRAYRNFGGYEEYAAEAWGAPGWAERYDCAVAPDRMSAALSTTLPDDLRLERTVRLLADRPGVEIASRLTNTAEQARAGVVLRAHPQFAFRFGAEGLALRARQADGTWRELPLVSDTWLMGDDLPAGAWGVFDPATEEGLVNEFDPGQVRACYVHVDARNGYYNIELFSQPRDLAPGGALELTHRYVLMSRGDWEGLGG